MAALPKPKPTAPRRPHTHTHTRRCRHTRCPMPTLRGSYYRSLLCLSIELHGATWSVPMPQAMPRHGSAAVSVSDTLIGAGFREPSRPRDRRLREAAPDQADNELRRPGTAVPLQRLRAVAGGKHHVFPMFSPPSLTKDYGKRRRWWVGFTPGCDWRSGNVRAVRDPSVPLPLSPPHCPRD